MDLEQSLAAAALLTTGIHAGVAIGFASATWPAALTLDDKAALKFFADFYPKGKALQPTLVATSALASGAALAMCPLTSLTQAAHIASMVNALFIMGWTVTVMYKDNDEMVALGQKGETSPKARQMLRTWGARHTVRTVACLGAFSFMTYAFLKR